MKHIPIFAQLNDRSMKLHEAERIIMWYKIHHLLSKRFKKSQIAQILGIHRSTVIRYCKMSELEFLSRPSPGGNRPEKLRKYEQYVQETLRKYPELSAAQVGDWIKEYDPSMPSVSTKTIYNFVCKVRKKYNIPKVPPSKRIYEKLPDTPYGQEAQVDFGEAWMRKENAISIKIYFFAIVLSRSRYKYVYFSKTPFRTETAIYAHELAFQFWQGKPRKIIYDQDKIFIHRENLGDYILTKAFHVFVKEQHFQPVFCRKADPESKGKIENVVKYVKKNFLYGRTFHDIETLNQEGLAWLDRTGNGKEHGTTRLIPAEEFKQEQTCLLPYHGIPHRPPECMEKHKMNKDNTLYYHGNYYSLPWGTYRDGNSFVWLQESNGYLEVFNKDTGKLICRHRVIPGKGQFVKDPLHGKSPKDAEEQTELLLKHTRGNPVVRTWLKSMKEDKPRYYRDNLKVLLRAASLYDKTVLVQAIANCSSLKIYNANTVISLCEAIKDGKYENNKELLDGLTDHLNQYDRLFINTNQQKETDRNETLRTDS